MVDPKQHASRQRLFAQAFSNSSILTFETVVRQMVDLTIFKIKRDAELDSADVLKWFTFMATDISGELSFGRSFDMLQREQVNMMSSNGVHSRALLTITTEKSVHSGPGDCPDDIGHAL